MAIMVVGSDICPPGQGVEGPVYWSLAWVTTAPALRPDKLHWCYYVCGREEMKMAAPEDDDRPKKKPVHEIGQDLALLSVEELSDRIALLNDEVARLRGALEKKRASRSAADQFFRR
jgi:uncharacterized small protein (DUF1192 family)